MDASKLAEVRRWAAELADAGDPALAAAGRTLVALAGAVEYGETVDLERLAKMRRRARVAAGESNGATLRAAARAVLLLVDELDSGHPTASRPQRSRDRADRLLRLPRIPLAALVAIGLALALAGAVAASRRALAPSFSANGPARGATLGRTAFDRTVVAAGRGAARWTLDGKDVTQQAHAAYGHLSLAALPLADGKHTVAITSKSGFLGARTVRRFTFTVDRRPPRIGLSRTPKAQAWTPLVLAGTIEDGARLTVGGRAVRVEHGHFSVDYRPPVPRTVIFAAVDPAGNRSTRRVRVLLEPRRPHVPVRAVHVTSYGWADKTLHAGVMQLIDAKRINAVELDLKDESGIVGFGSNVKLARRFGAGQKIYDLPSAVKLLHARGIRVIGRIVCFRDPIFAPAAWKAGHRDWVIQTPAHTAYSGYDGFANFANPVVRRYQIDIAVAAARAGVDDILYDYVRRPDGPISSMVFPGLRGTPEDAIVQFLQESRRALQPYGTYLGASVFGVAATRPEEVAQPIRRMARVIDYVAPMVYPSHWGPGEYRVANPNAEPYAIVQRSLQDFTRDVRGSGARVVPWLQDFTLGVTYGPTEVRAQIDAAKHDGIDEFILWDPAVTYTSGALAADAQTSRAGLARPSAARAPAPVALHVRVNATRKARVRTTTTAGAGGSTPVRRVGGRLPNELGQIPVLMHHEIRPDRVGDYDQTPEEFRAELERLWRDGYWPITAAQLVDRRLGDIPAGKTPVVLTFDDSTKYQLAFRGGKVVPGTAMAVMLDFGRMHPGFVPAGTFYVLREPFAGVPEGASMLRWLVRHGFELGNHTKDHIPLRTLSDTEVQHELALGQQILTHAVPGYRVRTMALPLGSMPHNTRLARAGRWRNLSYSDGGVFLVGANPAISPFSGAWDPDNIPRIRSSHAGWSGERDFAASYWLHELETHPETRYVSDGDPARISVPPGKLREVAPRFRVRARETI